MAYLERLHKTQGSDTAGSVSAITHLCFVVDLLICQANMDSIKVVRKVLNDFAGLSRLITNPKKNHVFL